MWAIIPEREGAGLGTVPGLLPVSYQQADRLPLLPCRWELALMCEVIQLSLGRRGSLNPILKEYK